MFYTGLNKRMVTHHAHAFGLIEGWFRVFVGFVGLGLGVAGLGCGLVSGWPVCAPVCACFKHQQALLYSAFLGQAEYERTPLLCLFRAG